MHTPHRASLQSLPFLARSLTYCQLAVRQHRTIELFSFKYWNVRPHFEIYSEWLVRWLVVIGFVGERCKKQEKKRRRRCCSCGILNGKFSHKKYQRWVTGNLRRKSGWNSWWKQESSRSIIGCTAQKKSSLKVTKKVIKKFNNRQKDVRRRKVSCATLCKSNWIETLNRDKKGPERVIFHAYSLLTRQEAPSGFCGFFSGRWLWDFFALISHCNRQYYYARCGFRSIAKHSSCACDYFSIKSKRFSAVRR